MTHAMAFLSNIGMTELLIIILVIVILFGSSKIPQLMRGMGSGINEFKKGLKEGEKEAAKEASKDAPKEEPKGESKPDEAAKK